MMRHRQRVQAAIVAAIGLLLSGCVSAAGSPDAEPSLGAIPQITSPDQVVFPIDSFLPSVDQTVALMLEGTSLVNACVQAGGGTSAATWSVANPANSADMHPASQTDLFAVVSQYRQDGVTRSGWWGLFTDLATAAQVGYQMAPGSKILALDMDVNDPLVSDCVARVDAVSPGGSVTAQPVVNLLPDDGPQYRPDDSRFVAVEQQWSACMKGQGFDYATPNDAIGSFTSPGGPTVTAVEKATASADIQCKIQTNLVGIGVAVQSAYDQQYIDTHREQLAALQTQIADYLAGRVQVPSQAPSTEQPVAIPS